MGESPTSAPAVMKLVQDQLTEERSTKTSLETRAIGVITSSGALATLLLGLAALVTKPAEYVPPALVRVILGVSLVAFIASAVLAIVAARPGTYHEVDIESLRSAASKDAMGAPAEEGEPTIAGVLVDIIDIARENNGSKAKFLRRAVTLEGIAAALLAVALSIAVWIG